MALQVLRAAFLVTTVGRAGHRHEHVHIRAGLAHKQLHKGDELIGFDRTSSEKEATSPGPAIASWHQQTTRRHESRNCHMV
mmetsp:Transcript_13300/g.26744  ORF Transcript_13300/g.26744 Transcript_13300/m.26744 type:complete len:81 (-) Transcript_13300:512-754(-)